jgi:AraC-like DNA-binding protein
MMKKAGDFMNSERHPVIITEVGDISIRSVLDSGFTQESEVAPVVHAHAFYELIMGVEGVISVDLQGKETGGESLSVGAGEVCLIPPGVYHSTRAVSDAPVKLALRFNLTENAKGGGSALCRVLTEFTAPKMLEDGGRVCKIMCEIREELNNAALASREYVHTLLAQLYILLFRMLDRSSRGEAADVILSADEANNRQIQIEEYMLAHFAEPLTEEDLAAHIHLSKRQVSRILRQLFGKSFRQMLIDVRLSRAAQLLSDTDMPIEDIAAAVGYTSLSGFYTAFRKRYGMTVGEYRCAFMTKK